MEGYKNQICQKIEGKGQGALAFDLARRPGWGGGSLAFRRAGFIFDAVLFERCVGGVVDAMVVASNLFLVCWFLWGIVLGAFWKPLGVVGASLGLLGVILCFG